VLAVVEERVGIPVAVIDLDGFAGAYIVARGRPFIFVHEGDSVVRKRFSLAHELGHNRLGHPPVVETWDAIYAHDKPPAEVQANAFAAEFVAPRDGILAWLEAEGRPPVTLDVVCRLSARYGLSVEATRYRLNTVGVLRDPVLEARLDAEIADGDHRLLIEHLGLAYPEDGLARAHTRGPRLPQGAAAGTLGALLRGEVDLARAAAALGQDAAHLEQVVEAAGIPC
jgi:Zn-dependent peptidase ImmA (M78 family)